MENIAVVEANIRSVNPHATVLWAESPVTVTSPESVKGNACLSSKMVPRLRTVRWLLEQVMWQPSEWAPRK